MRRTRHRDKATIQKYKLVAIIENTPLKIENKLLEREKFNIVLVHTFLGYIHILVLFACIGRFEFERIFRIRAWKRSRTASLVAPVV